jgi:hypothetical protein
MSADKVAFRLRETSPGYVLTYKDLRPASYPPAGSRQNSRVVRLTTRPAGRDAPSRA